MTKLLYVECSPRKTMSVSIEVGRAFLDVYRRVHPDDAIETYDIWEKPLPEFGEAALNAKYAGLYGEGRTPEQQRVWDVIETLAEPFLVADKILLTVPLWNFSIPYRFKQLIDLISQKDVLFSFDDDGFAGRVKANRAAVIYARGLDYAPTSTWTPGESYDFQRPYVEAWLKLIGVTDIDSILIERTLFGLEAEQAARANAKFEAERLALEF
ncbi:NAD(P)H-dependent oxidoreductase [Mesorhizobium sp. M0684]|uniref:FMN-dependent NADH-azoreductase n=1 Tax=unclassified Mesorhizobium TaxID=325217 RepID=UPI00333BD33B